MNYFICYSFNYIREQITPKGDGNWFNFFSFSDEPIIIREQITPKGDGNKQIVIDNEDEIEKLENR